MPLFDIQYSGSLYNLFTIIVTVKNYVFLYYVLQWVKPLLYCNTLIKIFFSTSDSQILYTFFIWSKSGLWLNLRETSQNYNIFRSLLLSSHFVNELVFKSIVTTSYFNFLIFFIQTDFDKSNNVTIFRMTRYNKNMHFYYVNVIPNK